MPRTSERQLGDAQDWSSEWGRSATEVYRKIGGQDSASRLVCVVPNKSAAAHSMRRTANFITSCAMLAATFFFSGCLLMMADSQPREFSLKNKCPFPVLVIITYDSGIERNVNLDAGDKEGQTAMESDQADTFRVLKNGTVLYSFNILRDSGVLTYNLSPTGVTIQGK